MEIISGECSIWWMLKKLDLQLQKILKKDILSGITKADQISESYVLHVGLILNTSGFTILKSNTPTIVQ